MLYLYFYFARSMWNTNNFLLYFNFHALLCPSVSSVFPVFLWVGALFWLFCAITMTMFAVTQLAQQVALFYYSGHSGHMTRVLVIIRVWKTHYTKNRSTTWPDSPACCGDLPEAVGDNGSVRQPERPAEPQESPCSPHGEGCRWSWHRPYSWECPRSCTWRPGSTSDGQAASVVSIRPASWKWWQLWQTPLR